MGWTNSLVMEGLFQLYRKWEDVFTSRQTPLDHRSHSKRDDTTYVVATDLCVELPQVQGLVQPL